MRAEAELEGELDAALGLASSVTTASEEGVAQPDAPAVEASVIVTTYSVGREVGVLRSNGTDDVGSGITVPRVIVVYTIGGNEGVEESAGAGSEEGISDTAEEDTNGGSCSKVVLDSSKVDWATAPAASAMRPRSGERMSKIRIVCAWYCKDRHRS